MHAQEQDTEITSLMLVNKYCLDDNFKIKLSKNKYFENSLYSNRLPYSLISYALFNKYCQHRVHIKGKSYPYGILVDYKNKMVKDTTMKVMLFERVYSKVLLYMHLCI